MSSDTIGGSAGSKRSPAVIALVVVAAVFVILAVLFFMGVNLGLLNTIGHSGKVNTGSHGLRGGVSVIIAVLALGGAWFMNKKSAS